MRIDRRSFPRRPAKWSVGIQSSGVALTASSVDVGLDGMQLSLDRGGLLRLCPRGHLTSRADELDLTLTLRPQEFAADEPIEILARVHHVRRLSQFEYRLGVEFLEFLVESGGQRFTHLLEHLAAEPNISARSSQPLECEH